jgi:hypothetical protein
MGSRCWHEPLSESVKTGTDWNEVSGDRKQVSKFRL